MPTTTKRILLVDDDEIFASVLARALRSRGYAVSAVINAADALATCSNEQPDFAVVDLKLGADNGLSLIPQLISIAPKLRIVLLTGYASIATAVEAIKRGAHDYRAKPTDADAILHALLADGAEASQAGSSREVSPPLRRLEWEHIQRVLADSDGNVSEAARRLGLHRRTLQRKLSKRPVREADPH